MGYSPGGGGGSGPSPATTVTGPDAYGASAVVGTGTTYARNDHDHGLPAAPSGGGGLLASIQYGPAVYASNLSTSTSLVTVDSTHLTISFTAPASGKVLVRLTGACILPATAYGYWALLDHTSRLQIGDTVLAGYSGNFQSSAAFLITGLTPGADLQYDWAYATSLSAIYLPVQGAQGIPGGVNGAPAVMEVWSA